MLAKLKSGHWPIFLMSSFSSIANLYLPIFLARVLAPEEMGVYKVFFLYLGAIPFIFLTGGPLHSVYYWVGKEKADRNEYMQQSFTLALLLSSLILFAGFPLKGIIAGFTNLKAEYISLMLLSAFFTVPAGYYAHAKIALGSTVGGSLYDTFFEVSKVVSFIAIAYLTKDIGYIFLSFCLIFGLKFFISIVLKIKENLISFTLNPTKLKEIFSYCLPISLAGLVTFFVDKMDHFVLAAQLPSDQFAFYSMGCLLIPPLYMLEMSVASVLIPKLSKGWIEKSEDSLEHYRKAISDVAFLMVPAFFGLWIFADPIVKLLYTDKFIQAGDYLKLFSLSYLILIIPYDAVPRATGRTQWVFKLTLAIGVFSLIGVLIASKYFGAVETLLTALAFKFAARLGGLIYSANIMNWPLLATIPWKKMSYFFGVSLTLGIASYLLKEEFSGEMAWFFGCAPAFAVLYLLFIWLPQKKGFLHD